VVNPERDAPGTSDSSLGFSTPQSQASSQGAGEVEGEDLSKVGLFVVRKVDDVCGGTVGGGGGRKEGPLRFCTRPSISCKFKTHDRKVALRSDTYYVKCPKGQVARFEPSLSMGCRFIPTDKEGKSLDTCTATLEVWVTFINSVGARDSLAEFTRTTGTMQAVTGLEETKVGEDSPDSSWESIRAPTLDTFRRDVESLKTPGRYRIK
jgi:hypothetical protein